MAEKKKRNWFFSLLSGDRDKKVGEKKSGHGHAGGDHGAKPKIPKEFFQTRSRKKPVTKQKAPVTKKVNSFDHLMASSGDKNIRGPEPHSESTEPAVEKKGFSIFGRKRDSAAQTKTGSEKLKMDDKEIVREFIASDVMTRKVVSIRSDDTLDYVLRLFSEKNISGAPVVGRTGNLVGTLSETDLSQYVGEKELIDAEANRLDELKEKKVQDVMKRNVITVYEHTPLHEINQEMNKHDIARVIVIDHKRQVLGIVTRADMINGIAKEMLIRICHNPREVEKSQINTEVDDVLETVDKRGVVSVAEISKKLGIDEGRIEEWGKVLEKHGLIEIIYPPVGKPFFKRKGKKNV